MNRLVRLLIAFFLSISPCFAVPMEPDGQGPTGMTASLPTIAATSTTVTLTAPSRYVTIINTSSTVTIYFNPVSPATTSNTPILPLAAYSYTGSPLSVLYLISGSGSVSAGIIAH